MTARSPARFSKIAKAIPATSTSAYGVPSKYPCEVGRLEFRDRRTRHVRIDRAQVFNEAPCPRVGHRPPARRSSCSRCSWTIACSRSDTALDSPSSGPPSAIGKVVGVDHSERMHRQATRRSVRAIQTGRIELHTVLLDAMPAFDGQFDKVFAVNGFLFLPDAVAALAKLAAVMKPGNTIALTFQPRTRGATSTSE